MKNSAAVYVPQKKEIVYLVKGTGDNLCEEDYDEGYVDYIEYTQYLFDCGRFVESDGGELLLKEDFEEIYKDIEDAIRDTLEFAYDEKDLDYVILEGLED